MNIIRKLIFGFFIIANLLFVSACTNQAETSQLPPHGTAIENKEEQKTEEPKIPNLQAELLNGENATCDLPIGDFNFKNFTYPLPRGWQDADSKEVTLDNGKRRVNITEGKIGMEYVTTKFFDVTGDEKDEAVVILRVLTGGGAIPQIVYIYEWNDETPELLWYFRTGDRADGGLKKIYAEEDKLVIELYGRDRYIFSQMETSKIVGDEQQLCCPSHWTKTRYKKEGSSFRLQGDRWTYSLKNEGSPPVKNMNELKLKEERGS